MSPCLPFSLPAQQRELKLSGNKFLHQSVLPAEALHCTNSTCTACAASFIYGLTIAISRPTEWALLDILKIIFKKSSNSKVQCLSVRVHRAEKSCPLLVTEVCSWLAHQYSARILGKLVHLLPSSDVFEMCSSKMSSLLPLILSMDKTPTDSSCGRFDSVCCKWSCFKTQTRISKCH